VLVEHEPLNYCIFLKNAAGAASRSLFVLGVREAESQKELSQSCALDSRFLRLDGTFL